MRLKFAILLTTLLLVSCVMPSRRTPTPLPPTGTPEPTATTPPTATPVIPLTILVLPADMPADQSELYQKTIYDLSYAAGMRYQLLNTLTPADLELAGPALKVVVVLPPDPGLATLVTAAPGVQFLALGIPDLPAAPNLTAVGTAGQARDQQAFLAGYIAAMLTPESRTGLLIKEDAAGQAALTAFSAGMHYYCGLCQQSFAPIFAPYSTYPLHPEIPVDTPSDQYSAYVTALHQYQVQVAYIVPELATPEVANAMSQHGILMIGESLPSEDLRPGWVVSIQPDLLSAVKRIFPELAAGNGGQALSTPLFLTDVNPNLLSEGKLRLVEEVLADLQAGYIDTGVQP